MSGRQWGSTTAKKLLRGPIAVSPARLLVAYPIRYVFSLAARLFAREPLVTLFAKVASRISSKSGTRRRTRLKTTRDVFQHTVPKLLRDPIAVSRA